MDRGSHSNASGAKRAGLTIPHLSVDKKGAAPFVSDVHVRFESFCVYIFQL